MDIDFLQLLSFPQRDRLFKGKTFDITVQDWTLAHCDLIITNNESNPIFYALCSRLQGNEGHYLGVCWAKLQRAKKRLSFNNANQEKGLYTSENKSHFIPLMFPLRFLCFRLPLLFEKRRRRKTGEAVQQKVSEPMCDARDNRQQTGVNNGFVC